MYILLFFFKSLYSSVRGSNVAVTDFRRCHHTVPDSLSVTSSLSRSWRVSFIRRFSFLLPLSLLLVGRSCWFTPSAPFLRLLFSLCARSSTDHTSHQKLNGIILENIFGMKYLICAKNAIYARNGYFNFQHSSRCHYSVCKTYIIEVLGSFSTSFFTKRSLPSLLSNVFVIMLFYFYSFIQRMYILYYTQILLFYNTSVRCSECREVLVKMCPTSGPTIPFTVWQ